MTSSDSEFQFLSFDVTQELWVRLQSHLLGQDLLEPVGWLILSHRSCVWDSGTVQTGTGDSWSRKNLFIEETVPIRMCHTGQVSCCHSCVTGRDMVNGLVLAFFFLVFMTTQTQATFRPFTRIHTQYMCVVHSYLLWWRKKMKKIWGNATDMWRRVKYLDFFYLQKEMLTQTVLAKTANNR